jgi:hypothetical protein
LTLQYTDVRREIQLNAMDAILTQGEARLRSKQILTEIADSMDECAQIVQV